MHKLTDKEKQDKLEELARDLHARLCIDLEGWQLVQITKNVKFFDSGGFGLIKGEYTIGKDEKEWHPGINTKTGKFKTKCFQTVKVFNQRMGLMCQIGTDEYIFL